MRCFKSYQFYWLIALIIAVNAIGFLFPILRNDDPPLYASIAKNMLINHDFINLTHFNHDWLDKPHFPFWLTALSYTIFGINSFAYILPGFLFHLLGAYYTYKLAVELYNKEVGLIAAIIYLSSIHLMLSSIDVRAEAYLLGTIIPACYYWYKYNNQTTLKSLLLGALFTACAVMTKGIFVVVTIVSGLLVVWLYTKELRNIIRLKWLLALFLSLALILPELIALYIQFDLHPQKYIYHHTHVSGIKWFFWDSQFGRFFNNGPIVHSGSESISHYFFFIHTFLWSFLPWSFILIATIIGLFRNQTATYTSKRSLYYILGSFLPTFILFSVSHFQLDYYTNILIPFAAILCANYLVNFRECRELERVFSIILYLQIGISIILSLLAFILSLLIFGKLILLLVCSLYVLVVIGTLFIIITYKSNLDKILSYSTAGICLVFIFIMFIYGQIYSNYDVGYQAAVYLNKQNSKLPVVDYNIHSLTLEFHSNTSYFIIEDPKKLQQITPPFYMLIKSNDFTEVRNYLSYRHIRVLKNIDGTTIDIVLGNLVLKPDLMSHLTHYVIIRID